MIKAVLLDLDNTLLHNPDRQFAVAFLNTIDTHFQKSLKIDQISTAFREGIGLLSGQRDCIQTNTNIMTTHLASYSDSSPETIHELLGDFYETVYRDLKRHTKPVKSTQNLIANLLKQDIAVAIATNPIYPQTAVYERLSWAGLSSFIDEFAFITHSDNMHFSKPNPAYYAEVVARIGIEPDETLMIGDSTTNDIQPATQLGIHTIHVTNHEQIHQINEHVQQSDWRNQYFRYPLTLDMIIPQYNGNLGAIYGLLSEVKEHQWTQHPMPNEWSILQILSHLQISEYEVQRYRLLTILEKDNPFIISPKPPGPNIPSCHPDGYHIANQFLEERQKTIDLLNTLTPNQWQRPARHSIFGMTNLLEMAHFTAQHDRLHINQLCQTIGRCD